MWTLETALETCRLVETAISQIGWHVSMGGGVIHSGGSSHDLDLVVFPHRVINDRWEFPYPQFEPLRETLQGLGWSRQKSFNQMWDHWWFTKGHQDAKHVEVWTDQLRRRIDIIMVR